MRDFAELDVGSEIFTANFLSLQERAKKFLEKTGRKGEHLLEARQKAAETRRRRMLEMQDAVYPVIKQLRADGKTSLRQIAFCLDKMGIKPPASEKWRPSSVTMIERAGDAKSIENPNSNI
jgi:DNA-binding protein H-NS